MINVGLVGFGFAGRVFHAPIISAVAGLELRAILQRSSNEAALCYPKAQIVRSMDELLAIDEIKLVVIATPNASHYPLARQCLLAGPGVVFDKSFTTSHLGAADPSHPSHHPSHFLTFYPHLHTQLLLPTLP